MGENSTASVLDEVRSALGRTETIKPQMIPEFVDPTKWSADVSLVEQFTAEATAVGAKVTIVTARELIADRVIEICRGAGATQVALSGSEFLSQCSLKGHLEQSGFAATSVSSFGDRKKEVLIAHLASREVGVTTVAHAIAETGTIAITSDEDQALLVSLLPPIHIAIVESSQIKQSLTTVLSDLARESIGREGPCRSATFITGPSRTADVELTLTIGVHGPKELHLIVLAE
jgi:L-lactate dehydrogenase complex protein LldG